MDGRERNRRGALAWAAGECRGEMQVVESRAHYYISRFNPGVNCEPRCRLAAGPGARVGLLMKGALKNSPLAAPGQRRRPWLSSLIGSDWNCGLSVFSPSLWFRVVHRRVAVGFLYACWFFRFDFETITSSSAVTNVTFVGDGIARPARNIFVSTNQSEWIEHDGEYTLSIMHKADRHHSIAAVVSRSVEIVRRVRNLSDCSRHLCE